MNADCIEGQSEPRRFWEFFSIGEWGFFWAVIVVGLLLRWYGLGDRALHHDESLHAMWGKYFFDHPSFRFYKYDPMLHGPLLYNTLFFTYFSLGDSEWSARFPVALIGSIGLFLPLLFRKYFAPLTVLLLTAFVAISPTLVFWSRFIRHDFFVLTGIFLALYGATVASGGKKAYLVLIGISLQFCAKENSFVHLAILLGYLAFEPLFSSVVLQRASAVPWGFWAYAKKHLPQIGLGVGMATFIYVVLYSAWFLYPEGVLDGLYRKSVLYWWEQSALERIKGPFMFHFYVLGFYESLFVIACLVQIVLFYWESHPILRILGGITAALASLAWVVCAFPPEGLSHESYLWKNQIWKFLKLKNGFDVFGAVFFSAHAVLLTVGHLLRGEQRLAITGYFFWALLFSYSYLGEKVPWLTLYPFIAGVIYLALYFQDFFQRRSIPEWRCYANGKVLFYSGVVLLVLGIVFMLEEGGTKQETNTVIGWLVANNLIYLMFGAGLAVLGILDDLVLNRQLFGRANLRHLVVGFGSLYLLRATALTNFVYGGNAREFLSQVHTAEECLDVVKMVVSEVQEQPRGYAPHVYVGGDAVWPLTWYFRKLPTYDYLADEAARNNFLFRVEDWKENSEPPLGYRARRFNLRGWWVPDYNTMSLKKFFHYAINHEPWNPPGFAYANLYYRINPEGQPLVK